MAIADVKLVRRSEARPWRTCQVCHALANIPAAEAKALRKLLADPSVRYQELSEALAADADTPLDLHPDALSRHARGRCEAKDRLR